MKKIILWWERAAIVALFLFITSCKSEHVEEYLIIVWPVVLVSVAIAAIITTLILRGIIKVKF